MSAEIRRLGSVKLEGREQAFERFDDNGDGKLDAEEFAEIEEWNKSNRQKVVSAFEVADHNGDGVLDRVEFQRFLTQIDPVLFTTRNIQILMAEADADADGEVHYIEFITWLYQEDCDVVEPV